MIQNTDRKVFMKSERETVIDRQLGEYGYNVYDDYLDEEVICICGWQGTVGQLLTATGLKFDVELIYCPDCGSDDVGEL